MKLKEILLLIFLILIGTALGLGIYINMTVLSQDNIYGGVFIDGVALGNRTYNEAYSALERAKEDQLANKNVKFYYMDYNKNKNVKELGFEYKYKEAIDKAFEVGRTGNKIDRTLEIYKVNKEGRNIDLDYDVDTEKVGFVVDEIGNDINVDKVEGKVSFDGANFKVTDSKKGYKLDNVKLYEDVLKNLAEIESIPLPVEETLPNVNTESLKRINGIIGSGTTSFKTSSNSRKENIRLSANAFKGKVLMPGDVISYNETTGPRSKKAGYKEANVIINREYVEGVGGGVCQTSTTLYQALLDADLEIVERYPHSLPPAYVLKGTDAAVSFGSLDLKFKNSFDFPVYIDTIYTGNSVKFNIYGDTNSKDYKVKLVTELKDVIEPKVVYEEDSSLPAGYSEEVQKGRTGYKVDTYKVLVRNGQEINRQRITRDYYREKSYIYKKGVSNI